VTAVQLEAKTLEISRIASIFLLVAYVIYLYFQVRSHHSIYDAVLLEDEENEVELAKTMWVVLRKNRA